METSPFLSLRALADRLGLPAAWIKSEAKAGRIPVLYAGRRMMFKESDVRHVLEKRASGDMEVITNEA